MDWLHQAAVITVEGSDGSMWTVSGDPQEQPVDLDRKLSKGWYEAPVVTRWVQSAFGEGASFNGLRYEPRDLTLAFHIYGDEQVTWESNESRFRFAWDYVKPTKIHVQTPESGMRTLTVTLMDEPESQPDMDPHVGRYSRMVVTARAADPFYRSEPYGWEFEFPGGPQKSFVHFVSNPTDIPAYVQWVKRGRGKWSISDVSLTQETRHVVMPDALTNVNYSVFTRPDVEQVVAPDVVDAWRAMGGQAFLNSVPPRSKEYAVQANCSSGDAGAKMAVIVERRWSRPWGAA